MEGEVEHSFSMGWSRNHIRGYDHKFIDYYMNDPEGKKLWTSMKKNGCFLVRLNSKKCPIDIDWEEYKNNQETKFERRNLPFKEKDLLLQKAELALRK